MLKHLVLKEFQNHERSELEFSDGLNIIRGASDNGKSAIIRAIRLLVENKPSGDGFRRTDGEGNDTVVTGTFDEHTIKRIKGKRNLYILDGTEYKAVGTGVPKEISDVIDFNDTNLQSQFSPHFLLSESSGEVAKQLNNIVGLSDIDLAHKVIRRIITELRSEIKFGDVELGKSKDKYDSLLPVIAIDEVLKALEKTGKSIEEQKESVDQLQVLIGKIKAVQTKLEPLEDLISFEEKADHLLGLGEELDQSELAISKITTLISKIKKTEDQISKITIPVDKKWLDDLVDVGELISLEKDDISDLTDLIYRLGKAREKGLIAIAEEQEAQKLYKIELKRIGQCPLCGGNL